ncbi:hypothetical protein SCMU_27820 [Sinomonas cyclohexanicum]|uniref:Uncharacterized protein n=1 Tax=Sinomonas cyclohexanicum TaxID=322009 RepID=A0ABM7PXB7_SINCY|nr:hypothetical protein [Corynebacterium cyclohexanicum]BCT76940.1 hypothetical protein SCMU_27820 [Corynebacterium cyclohexanicum]
MRRRRPALPAPLDFEQALPEFVDDLSEPYPVRRARWDAWMVGWEELDASVKAWYAVKGIEEPPEDALDRIRLRPMQPFDGYDGV